MKSISELKRVVITGTEWEVHCDKVRADLGLWRVAKTQTNGFWIEGNLLEDRRTWSITEIHWPKATEVEFHRDGSFTTFGKHREKLFTFKPSRGGDTS